MCWPAFLLSGLNSCLRRSPNMQTQSLAPIGRLNFPVNARNGPCSWNSDSAVFIKTAGIHVEPRECNPKQNPSHCLQNNLHPTHRKKRNAKDWQTGWNIPPHFFFSIKEIQKQQKKVPAFPSQLTTMSWAVWEAGPHPPPQRTPPWALATGNNCHNLSRKAIW